MKKLIKKILMESEFDWIRDLPAEDDVIYLNLNVAQPDWESVEDATFEEPEWDYWTLYLYVPKQVYRDITGQDTTDNEWDEWSDDTDEGDQLLNYFYKNNFDRMQKYGLSTAIDDDVDCSFSVTSKGKFCGEVGNFHPDRCNPNNR